MHGIYFFNVEYMKKILLSLVFLSFQSLNAVIPAQNVDEDSEESDDDTPENKQEKVHSLDFLIFQLSYPPGQAPIYTGVSPAILRN